VRFLADAGVSPKTVDFLKQLGHDVVHVRTVGLARAADAAHDASLYSAYLRAEERLREQGGEVRRVVLEQELKTEYQQFLEENRRRSDSDGGSLPPRATGAAASTCGSWRRS
jgi:hypothetical protein